MRRDRKVVFSTRRQLVQEHIPNVLAKTMELYVLPAIATCATPTITFDLWMSRAGFDTFALVVNFIDDCWVPRYVPIGLFEAPNTSGGALEEIVKPLLEQFQLKDKIIACVSTRVQICLHLREYCCLL